MGKFKMESISGFGESQKKEKTPMPKERYKLGSELLDERSKNIVKLKISNIPRDRIVKNPENKYSISKIDELRESIKNYGLAEPLNVKPIADDEFMLLGGERRITAIDQLIEDETVKDWDEFTLIPCIVKDVAEIKLPLSEKNKERYAVITTNKEARKYTDSDRFYEMQAWKEIIEELRKNGVEEIAGEDENGETQPLQIKGEKTIDILSKATGMSRGQVQKYEKVEKKASPELLNAMLDNNISVGVAEKAVDTLNDEEQKILAKASEEKKINPADIKEFKSHSNMTAITAGKFKKDTANINNAIKEGNAYLAEDEEQEYYKLIKKLESIIVKGE